MSKKIKVLDAAFRTDFCPRQPSEEALAVFIGRMGTGGMRRNVNTTSNKSSCQFKADPQLRPGSGLGPFSEPDFLPACY
jgi:hypothetical protein